ncbi:MAG: hypothetical protein ACLQVX_12750 [Limisphaerales bacterium]
MTLLPIIQRELLVRARDRGTGRLRLGVALAGVLICLPLWLFAGPFSTPGTVGRQIFSGLVGAAFVLCCAGCLLTADAVGWERREGTLGLLFLTRVKAADVLLGKFGANGFNAVCGLAALLPLLMIPVLLGGVTGGEAGRKGLALLGTLCLALAAGLHQSASHPRQFWAEAGAVVLVLAVVLLPAIPVPGLSPGAFWHWFSPLSTMGYAGDLSYRASGSAYWVSLAVVQAMAWLLLAGASLRLRRAVVEAGSAETALVRVAPPGHAGRARAIGENESPVEWLVRRQPGLRAALWVAVLAAVITRISSVFLFRLLVGPNPVAGILSGLPWFGMHLLCWAVFAWTATRFFVEARRTGELELLRTTPLGAGQIVAGQWRALKRLLFAPALLLALTIFAGFFLQGVWVTRSTGRFVTDPSWRLYMLTISVLSTAEMALGLAALCWLGLWFGLRSAGQAGAIIRTLGIGQVVPYAISVFSSFLVWPLRSFLFGSIGLVPMGFFWLQWLPQLLVLVYLAWMIRWAMRRLYGEFPEADPVQALFPREAAAGNAGSRQAGQPSPFAGGPVIP